jgi:hypothetical protein
MLKQLARKKHEQEEGRGVRAPALLAALTGLVRRSGRASRGYVLAGVGVVAAAVMAVSLLSWLAPDSDRPIGHPLEVVVEQVVALIGADGETVLSSARQGVAAAGSRIPWAGERLREIATDRSASAGPAPVPVARPTPNTGVTAARERFSSPTTNGSSAPQAMREPSRESLPPSGTSSSPSSSTGETAPPAEVEEPTPATSGPAPPLPPAAERPSPTVGEPPTVEEPSTTLPAAEEPPPTTEEPAPPATEEPPPITDQPALPPTEGPPPATNQPPPPTNQPPPMPPPVLTQPPPPPTGAHDIDRSGVVLGFLYPLSL